MQHHSTLSSEERLKKVDLRITAQRVSLLDFILTKSHAVSNQDMEGVGDMDRITLYRTLKSFEEKGIIHKIVDHNGASKYALCLDECSDDHHDHNHVHFHCHHCDNTVCIDVASFPAFNLPSGFQKHSTEVMVCGICDKCS